MSGTADLDPAVAAAALGKLRRFVESLDDDERAVVAALLAPAVTQAYAEEPEVVGFQADGWLPHRLPDVLADEVRTHGWRIEAHPAERPSASDHAPPFAPEIDPDTDPGTPVAGL